MKTEIIKLDSLTSPLANDKIQYAARVIKSGGLVVFPTETVYGLGGDGTNPVSARKIYEAKGRPSDNPLIIHIDTPEMAEEYAITTPLYYKLANRFMPGPLTVVMKAKDSIPLQTRGGLDTVAVRCPSSEIARELIKASGVPIAAPSANLSGSPSPTRASHVIDDLDGRVDVIIDGGDSDFGLESTIVKIEDDESITLLRPGKITPYELSDLGYKINIADAVVDKLKDGDVALSPGMKYKHYAPSAPLTLISGKFSDTVDHIRNENSESLDNIAIICYDNEAPDFRSEFPRAKVYNFGSKHNPEEQAHSLFSILRDTDKHAFAAIYAPLPEIYGIGLALYNRMIRAAAHKIIRL